MATVVETKEKYDNFVGNLLGNKTVDEIPGINTWYAQLLCAHNFQKVS